jgi:hypothetical protein
MPLMIDEPDDDYIHMGSPYTGNAKYFDGNYEGIQYSMGLHRCDRCNTAIDYPCYFAATSYRKEGSEPGYCLECFAKIMTKKMENNKNAAKKRQIEENN